LNLDSRTFPEPKRYSKNRRKVYNVQLDEPEKKNQTTDLTQKRRKR